MTAVAKQDRAVPALVATPALDLDGSDFTPPSIKIGQDISGQVKSGSVRPGQVFWHTPGDDDTGYLMAEKGEPVRMYVLALRKGKSLTKNRKLQTFGFRDPAAEQQTDDNGKLIRPWTTYTYTVFVPEHDTEIPFRVLLTKSGKPAADQINSVLMRNAQQPPWAQCFALKAVDATSQHGDKFYKAQVTVVDANDDEVAAAEQMYLNAVAGGRADEALPESDDAPAI